MQAATGLPPRTRVDSRPWPSSRPAAPPSRCWIIARGDLVGADARAYWGGVRLWLGGGDPLDPPPPYLPYVYWSWSLPLFAPWAALPWETAWFVYRGVNVLLFVWSVVVGLPAAPARDRAPRAPRHARAGSHARHGQHHAPVRPGHLGRALRGSATGRLPLGARRGAQVVPGPALPHPSAAHAPVGHRLGRPVRHPDARDLAAGRADSSSSSSASLGRCASTTCCWSGPRSPGCGPIRAGSSGGPGRSSLRLAVERVAAVLAGWWRSHDASAPPSTRCFARPRPSWAWPDRPGRAASIAWDAGVATLHRARARRVRASTPGLPGRPGTSRAVAAASRRRSSG